MATHPVIASIASKVGAAICAGGAAAVAAPTLGIGSAIITGACWAGAAEALLETLLERNYGSLESGLAVFGMPSRRVLIQQLYTARYPGNSLQESEIDQIIAENSSAIAFATIERGVYAEQYSPGAKAAKAKADADAAIARVAADAAARAVADARKAQQNAKNRETALAAEAKTKAAKQQIAIAEAAKKKAEKSRKNTMQIAVVGGGLLVVGIGAAAFFLSRK